MEPGKTVEKKKVCLAKQTFFVYSGTNKTRREGWMEGGEESFQIFHRFEHKIINSEKMQCHDGVSL